MEGLSFHEVDEARWPDFEALFESPGGPKYCWCMAWRARGPETKLPGPERKACLRRRVRDGVPVGLLGYLAGRPVAWCSIAPRSTYRGLDTIAPPEGREEAVWSIACFYARREVRRQGLTRRMIEAALEHAGARGAKIVEAYPVDPDSPSYRFMGFVGTFEAVGFRHVGTAGSRRHVMRYALA